MRNNVREEIEILVRTAPSKELVKWKDLKFVADRLQDDDQIDAIKWREEKLPKFGYGDGQEPDEYEYALYLIIIRPRLETDEEYVQRLTLEQRRLDKIEQQDKETYLRLKAKYEK